LQHEIGVAEPVNCYGDQDRHIDVAGAAPEVGRRWYSMAQRVWCSGFDGLKTQVEEIAGLRWKT
jgi:hypothetical protein